jgi:hypothetical protein
MDVQARRDDVLGGSVPTATMSSTCAIVVVAAAAMTGPKLRAVLR